MELTGTLLAESALIAPPTIFVTAYAYSRWSTKWSVAGAIAVTIAGLGLVSAAVLIPTAAALALVLW
jgi:putative MFS transporter